MEQQAAKTSSLLLSVQMKCSRGRCSSLFLIKIWPQLCFIFRETGLLMMWINVLFEKHPSTFLCQDQLISREPWGKKDQGSTFYYSEKLGSYRAVGRRARRKVITAMGWGAMVKTEEIIILTWRSFEETGQHLSLSCVVQLWFFGPLFFFK